MRKNTDAGVRGGAARIEAQRIPINRRGTPGAMRVASFSPLRARGRQGRNPALTHNHATALALALLAGCDLI